MDWTGTFDWWYMTTYYAGEYAADTEWQMEGYGYRTKCYYSYVLSMELFNEFSWSIDLYFTFFDITPYKHVVRWVRPEWYIYNMVEDGSTYWDINVSG